MENRKAIVVNYVAKHSYPYNYKIVEALSKKNINIIAIVSENMPEIEDWKKIDGLNLVCVKGYTGINDFIGNMYRFKKYELPRIIDKLKNYENVTIFDPMFTYWSYFINKCLKKYKYVYVLHDPKPHNSKLFVHNFLNKRLGVKASKIVILSEIFKNYTEKHYRKKSEDIFVIPQGSNVKSDKENIVPLIEYKKEKIYFLLQGRIDKYKGIDILAKAYKRVRNEFDNVELVIAGSGDISIFSDDIKDLKDFTLINRWLTDEEVIGFYNDRNVIAVLPYISATQSGVINGAMPYGTPVIASRCGGIPEQIQDGLNGYLVEPGNEDDLYNKMKYVLCHLDELDYIRNNAYKCVRAFDWETIAERFLEIL